MLTCLHCRTPEALDTEIARMRTMTSKPFGVNLTILGAKRGEPEFRALYLNLYMYTFSYFFYL